MESVRFLAIIYFLILAVMVIPILFVSSMDEIEIIDDWEKKSKIYYERLILASQATLGLILILTIFYLGKIHDYRRDFTKSQAKLFEIILKFKKKNPTRSWSVKNEIYEFAENGVKTFEEIEKELDKMKKNIIGILITFVVLLTSIFISAARYEDSILQNDFLVISLLLLASFVEFIIVWSMYESVVSIHRKSLKGILLTISRLKTTIEQ